MRVEQRIGRIDRLGQRFSDIRIVNLHYEDTVEADVYRALRDRISIFENVVGGLQPILARLPKLIEETVLSKSTGPDGKRDEAVKALENAISAGEGSALDLDDYADESLELSVRPDLAISLSDLRAILDRPKLLPLGSEAVHLNDKDYRFVDGYLPHAVRFDALTALQMQKKMLRGAGDRAGLVQRSGRNGKRRGHNSGYGCGKDRHGEASESGEGIEPQGALSTAPAQTRPGPPLSLKQTLILTDRQEDAARVAPHKGK